MKIFLAAIESTESFRLAMKRKPKNILMTHMYMRKMSKQKVESMLSEARANDMHIIVDSGAFTFLIKYAILRKDIDIEALKKQHRIEALEEGGAGDARLYEDEEYARSEFEKEFNGYVNKWLEYCEIYYKYADMIAEIDLDTLLGMDEMWKLRERYQQYHDKIIYTPHLGMKHPNKPETSEERKQLNKLFDLNPVYMGIGNIDYRAVEEFFAMNKQTLIEKKIKVHGFAQTSSKRMKQLPFYSVDSSTWLDGAKYGICFEFQDGWSDIKTHQSSEAKKLRHTWKFECEQLGINFEDFNNENNATLNEWNMCQWMKLADYWEKDITKNYWLTDEERNELNNERREETGINNLIVRPVERNNLVSDVRNSVTRICNVCNISDKCPKFQAGATCVFGYTELVKDANPREVLNKILDIQYGRVSQGVLMERVQGANLDVNVTKEVQLAAKIAKDIIDIDTKENGNTVEIKATGKKGVGILSQLFGKKEEVEEPIPTTFEEIP